MLPRDYYKLTYREFTNMLNGHHNKAYREYDHTRMICWMIGAVNRDPKKSYPSPKQFWPLPMDEEDVSTHDNLKQRLERAIQALLNRRNGSGS